MESVSGDWSTTLRSAPMSTARVAAASVLDTPPDSSSRRREGRPFSIAASTSTKACMAVMSPLLEASASIAELSCARDSVGTYSATVTIVCAVAVAEYASATVANTG